MNIFTEIANITTNKELNAVIDAIKAQATIVRTIESAKAKVGLAVGDTVTFTGKRSKCTGVAFSRNQTGSEKRWLYEGCYKCSSKGS